MHSFETEIDAQASVASGPLDRNVLRARCGPVQPAARHGYCSCGLLSCSSNVISPPPCPLTPLPAFYPALSPALHLPLLWPHSMFTYSSHTPFPSLPYSLSSPCSSSSPGIPASPYSQNSPCSLLQHQLGVLTAMSTMQSLPCRLEG